MADHSPLLVALPLDHETPDIVAAAKELASRLETPIVVAHALGRRRLESERGETDRVAEAKELLEPHLAELRDAGIEVREVIVEVAPPAELVIETAQRLGVELMVTGGGRPSTIRRWMVGSVAEAIVRRSVVPVWVARGAPPTERPVLCPVDLSPQSRLGLTEAIRMARLFRVPLSVITVVTESYATNFEHGQIRRRLEPDEDDARAQVEQALADFDLEDLEVTLTVTSGDPAERIVDAADEAGLLVVASRGYDPLVPDWLGPVTSRALRHSWCSALTIRHVDEELEERQRAIAHVAELYDAAQELMDADRPGEAVPLLELAAQRAPSNAAVQDMLARALEAVDRHLEARGRREIAALIRERLG